MCCPILSAIDRGHFNIVRLLIENNCDIECEDYKKWKPIHHACYNGNIGIVRLLIERNCDIESQANNNWRPIHIACQSGNIDIVKLLIENNCDIKCEDSNKWRPIHHACKKGSVDILQMLIDKNCDTECRTVENLSPIHIAKKNMHKNCIKFIQKYTKLSNNLETLKGKRKIDKLISKFNHVSNSFDEKDKIELSVFEIVINRNIEKLLDLMSDRKMTDKEVRFLSNLVNITRSEDKRHLIKDHTLYRCVKDGYSNGFHSFSCAAVINGPHKFKRFSYLEIAAQRGHSYFIDELLKKTVYDEQIWRKARIFAMQNGHSKIAESISEREFLITSRLKRNFSLLHTAVCDNDADMVKYLLEAKIGNENLNHDIFGTALALAHLLSHRRCIRVLEEFNVDPNTQNKYGQTPLHEAIASGTHDQCKYLIKRSDDINRKGFNNLPALHCAVIESCNDLCEQLTQYGADCSLYVNVSKRSEEMSDKSIMKPITHLTNHENALTLCLKINRTIYPCFQQILDENTSNYCDGSNNSLIHLAVVNLQPDLCKLLCGKGALVNRKNNNGNTCLLELLSIIDKPIKNDIEKIIIIIRHLIEFGADINIETRNGMSVFYLASQFDSEKLMISLLTNSPNDVNITENDFKVALEKKWLIYIGKLMKTVSKDVISAYITREIIMKSLYIGRSSLIKCLFDKSGMCVQQSVVEEILKNAAVSNKDDLFEYFIEKEISKPKLFDDGENLFTYLLKTKKLEYIRKLIKSINIQYFANSKNQDGQLPLQLAIEIDEADIIDYLVIYTNDVNNMDKDGKTALMQLLNKISSCDNETNERNCMKNIDLLIQKGADIYMKTFENEEVINYCSKPSLKIQIIKLFKNKKENINSSNVRKQICCICLDREIECAFQCGHLACAMCSDKLYRCPICQREITNCTKLYFN